MNEDFARAAPRPVFVVGLERGLRFLVRFRDRGLGGGGASRGGSGRFGAQFLPDAENLVGQFVDTLVQLVLAPGQFPDHAVQGAYLGPEGFHCGLHRLDSFDSRARGLATFAECAAERLERGTLVRRFIREFGPIVDAPLGFREAIGHVLLGAAHLLAPIVHGRLEAGQNMFQVPFHREKSLLAYTFSAL